MLLSIGMIVKNEEKYLRQCLSALQTLRDAVESELIIVDTGSTDKTVEIAKEFTDNVLHFDWINDFSAARNVSLKAAKGEWYMFIDADEVYQSCDDIIRFFRSGEYKKYNSAFINIRSYSNINDRTKYSECHLPRITKVLPETEFIGRVHESLSPMEFPRKLLMDVVDHYGYTFESDEELRKEKHERNSKLLLERLETDEKDTNPTLYKELFDTYNFLNDKTQAVEYAYKGIEICKTMKTDYILVFYFLLARLFFYQNRNEELLKVYDEYFAVDPEVRVKERTLDIEMYAFKAITLYNMKKYEEAYNEFNRYFRLDKKMTEEGICTREALYTSRVFNNINTALELHIYYVEVCLKLKKYKEAEIDFKKQSLESFLDVEKNFNNRIYQMLEYLRSTQAKTFGIMYNSLADELREVFLNAIRKKVIDWNDEDRRMMLNKLVSFNLSTPLFNRIFSIYKAYFVDDTFTQEMAIGFINEFGASYADILYIMMRSQMDISPFLAACVNIVDTVSDGFKGIRNFYEAVNGYSPENVSDDDQLYPLIKLYLYSTVGAVQNKMDMSNITSYVGACGMKYLEIYGEDNVPVEVLAAVIIAQIDIFRSTRRYKECIAALRQLIQLDKNYAPIAKEYQELIKSDMS